MTAKEYLEEYRAIRRRRRALTKALESIDNELISIGGVNYGDKVKSSPMNDPIGNIVIQLTNRKAKYGLQILELQARETIYENQIMKISEINDKWFEVLTYRYILNYDWKEIGAMMHKSRSQINLYHGEALKKFDELFKISNMDTIVQNRT